MAFNTLFIPVFYRHLLLRDYPLLGLSNFTNIIAKCESKIEFFTSEIALL